MEGEVKWMEKHQDMEGKGKGDGHQHGWKNLTRMQQAHYLHDINYYMLTRINRRPEGGGHRSMSTPLKRKKLRQFTVPTAAKYLRLSVCILLHGC